MTPQHDDVGDDGGAHREQDAALEPPQPDAEVVIQCARGGGDLGTNDAAFGRAFGEAKQACDDELGWACGDIMVEVDAEGCVAEVHSGALTVTGGQPWLDCLAGKLVQMCSGCEQSETRRFYESCTVL